MSSMQENIQIKNRSPQPPTYPPLRCCTWRAIIVQVGSPTSKISSPGLQQVLTENSSDGGSLKSGSFPEECGMQNKAWYAGSCDRQTAEAALLQYNKDSAYLVRRSSRYGGNQPFTLAVLYKSHVYNIPIRYVESSHQYSLGKDGRSQEELFDSVSSIIQSYTERPMTLIDGMTSAKEQTCLVFPVKP
nr:SH2 domain-containing protein 6-like [Anolis sagrei ordinatus]